MDSKELFARSLRLSPGGVHSPVRAFKSVGGEPLFFAKAEGAHITSVEGNTYVDFCQSFGPNILGHRDPDVAAVVRETQELAWSLGACEPYSLELAEFITEQIPFVEKIRFVCSGTEAVMTALRLARAATGRQKILKFAGCYHGHVDSMLVKAGSGLAGEGASDSAGVSDELASHTLVASLDDEATVESLFSKHGKEIAAVILEPLPANYGLLIQRREFLQKTFDLARSAGALVIFDEVISGFRVSMGGMAQLLDVQPDLVTYGKVIGGGFPVGAYAGSARLMDMMAPVGPVYQAGTLAANPLGMRAGLATLQKLKQQELHPLLEKRTENFCRALNEGFAQKGVPLNAISQGSLFWIHRKTSGPIRKLEDFAPDHGESFQKLFHACLKRGVFFAPSAYEVGFISLAHSEELLQEVESKIMDAVQEIYA